MRHRRDFAHVCRRCSETVRALAETRTSKRPRTPTPLRRTSVCGGGGGHSVGRRTCVHARATSTERDIHRASRESETRTRVEDTFYDENIQGSSMYHHLVHSIAVRLVHAAVDVGTPRARPPQHSPISTILHRQPFLKTYTQWDE